MLNIFCTDCPLIGNQTKIVRSIAIVLGEYKQYSCFSISHLTFRL